MNIAIVGAGTVGTAVAVRWTRAGHTIVGVAGRQATSARAERWLPGVRVGAPSEIARRADVIAVAVPDREIAHVASDIAPAVDPGAAVLHLSGALPLDVLDPVRRAGADVLAIHPLQTFADVAIAIDALEGAAIAVTAGDDATTALGERLAVDLGGRPFRLADDDRALYHAAAVFASNYLVVVSGAALELFDDAHVPDALDSMRPLQQTTLSNVARLGPRAALTGPAVRGDAETIDRNLESVSAAAPHLVPAYLALCRAAMDVAGDRLDRAGRDRVEEVLARWS